MANDTSPIVFKPSPGQSLGYAAVGAAIMAYGVWHASGGQGEPVRFFHYGSVPEWVAGWTFIALGFLLMMGGFVSGAGGCPVLTIGDSGIDFRACRGRPIHVDWSDVAGVEMARLPSPDVQFSGVDMIFLTTKDGRKINIDSAGDTHAIAAAIRRVAALRGVALS